MENSESSLKLSAEFEAARKRREERYQQYLSKEEKAGDDIVVAHERRSPPLQHEQHEPNPLRAALVHPMPVHSHRQDQLDPQDQPDQQDQQVPLQDQQDHRHHSPPPDYQDYDDFEDSDGYNPDLAPDLVPIYQPLGPPQPELPRRAERQVQSDEEFARRLFEEERDELDAAHRRLARQREALAREREHIRQDMDSGVVRQDMDPGVVRQDMDPGVVRQDMDPGVDIGLDAAQLRAAIRASLENNHELEEDKPVIAEHENRLADGSPPVGVEPENRPGDDRARLDEEMARRLQESFDEQAEAEAEARHLRRRRVEHARRFEGPMFEPDSPFPAALRRPVMNFGNSHAQADLDSIQRHLQEVRFGRGHFERILAHGRFAGMPRFVSIGDIDGMDYEELLALGDQLGPVNRGADMQTISTLPTSVIHKNVPSPKSSEGESKESSPQESSSCCICMEIFKDGDEVRTLPCFHVFHRGEIDKWLQMNKSCPICKNKIDSN